MADLQLTFAAQDYEHTRALTTGKVKAEGIELKHIDLFPAFTFQRMLGKREFECSEMAMTLYFSTLDLPDPPFIAIPVFPIRCFRHSAFFVRVGGPVREPKDLIGKTMGEFFFYGHDAGLWAKGVLEDEYGVRARFLFLQDRRRRPRLRAAAVAAGQGPRSHQARTYRCRAHARPDARGRRDRRARVAVVAALDPRRQGQAEAPVRRLRNGRARLFRKTRIFPIMHTLVIRRDVYGQNPWVAASLYKAFKAAKDMRLRAITARACRSTTRTSSSRG